MISFSDSKCIEETKDSTLCKNDYLTTKLTLLEEPLNFQDASLTCNALGGKFFIPKSESDFQELKAVLQRSELCNSTFVGGTKNGASILDVDGIDVPFLKWGTNQPNGRTIQNCIELSSKHDFSDGK